MGTEPAVRVLVSYTPGDQWRDHLWAWVEQRWGGLDCEVVLGHGAGHQGTYNHAQGFNLAAAKADGDVLICTEADIALDYGFVQAAVRLVRQDPTCWVLAMHYDQLTQEATDVVLAAPPTVLLGDMQLAVGWSGHGVSWCGGLVLSRSAFDAVGGYDERFTGWGGDDVAMACALGTLVGPHTRLEGRARHLWHPREGLDQQPPGLSALMHRYLGAAGNAPAMRRLLQDRAQ